MRIIAVINQKGGVGKTTITANLGHALQRAGNRVMLIDMDPQGQLTTSLGIFKLPTHGIDIVLLDQASLQAVEIHTRENLVLVPAGCRLAEVEHLNDGGVSRAALLDVALKRENLDYDFILLDCPPASGLLSANAIMAADEALIPVSGDYLSLNGVAHLLSTLKKFESLRSKNLQQWVVISRFHTRRRLSKEVRTKLLNHFPNKVLMTEIKEAAALAECPAVGRTIFEFRRTSNSAQDFTQLAHDLIERRTH